VHTIRVGYQDSDGFPLVVGAGKRIGNPPGIGVDIISKVAEHLSVELLVSRLPNNRVHASLANGVFDGSGFYSYNNERLKEGVYPMTDGALDKSKSIYTLSYRFYVLKGSSASWDGKKLSGATNAGANRGYSVVRDLRGMGINVIESKSTKLNLEMLLNGRIQAYAAQDGTIDPVIATYKKYRDLMKIGPSIKTKEYYFIFSHQYYEKNTKMAHRIWDKIEEVRGSVVSKYKNINFKPLYLE